MSQDLQLLSRIILELKEVSKKLSGSSSSTSGASEVTLQVLVDQTDQLENLLTQSNLNTESNNYTWDLQEVTVDGQTDTTDVVSVLLTLDGDGGSINGISLPSGTKVGVSNEERGDIITAINYTVPTSGNQRVLISYTKRV